MTTQTQEQPASEFSPVAAILGYLNFSNGRPDAAVQKAFNELFAQRQPQTWNALETDLAEALDQLAERRPAFADSTQARSVLDLVFTHLRPAYMRHHADLLFHISEEELLQPFFLARMCEAVLAAGGPWDEPDRITEAALAQLNDFVGHRPLAILENGRQAQVYSHEHYRPIPLYLKDAGVAIGRYHDLIEATLAQLEATPLALREHAGFHLDRLNEIAVDIRAHDSLHPVFKRTNYLFGEWDPHNIDNNGHFHRLVLRRVILDALTHWIETSSEISREERLHDASVVLAGTILMATAISGWGPAAHDSGVTLTHLLPIVAHQRDEFYTRMMDRVSGSRAKRLTRVIKQTRQPFGHVRQQLNMYLANYAAAQMQRRAIAEQYARLGFHDAARAEAARIPAVSLRMECEFNVGVEAALRAAETGALKESLARLTDATDLLNRGIECGAFIDPWNILGFQGQFPLFAAREDAIPDPRAEWLIDAVDRLFGAGRRALTESAGRGETATYRALDAWLEQTAAWWDRFATTVVQDMPIVNGKELVASARAVAGTIAEWRGARNAAGDLAFWRDRVDRLETPHAFSDVVEALLERRDPVAASGLLVQWLGQAEEIGLGQREKSFFHLATRWIRDVTEGDSVVNPDEQARLVRRFFDFIEANAGEFWTVPDFGDPLLGDMISDEADFDEAGDFDDDEDDDEESDLFGAAYDNMTFRDSSADGYEGDVMDSGGPVTGGEFEARLRHLASRLQFLEMLGLLWRYAAGRIVGDEDYQSAARGWLEQADRMRTDLIRLARMIGHEPLQADSGDFDANIEYDAQLQSKNHLLYLVTSAAVRIASAERLLRARIGDPTKRPDPTQDVLRGILRGDALAVSNRLPALFNKLSREPLLYRAVENGGDPLKVVAARAHYDLLTILALELPRLGLIKQTREVLRTALRMERKSRPEGLSVTEFDRLFRLSLGTVLVTAVRTRGRQPRERTSGNRPRKTPRFRSLVNHPAPRRRPLPDRQQRMRQSRRLLKARVQDMEIVHLVGLLVESYLGAWLRHAGTMRLSTVEEFNDAELWLEVKKFIHRFGAELFHARVLPLANLRAILHEGIDQFLEFLEENDDPLHPSPLVAALQDDPAFRPHAERMLTLIFSAVVDEMERFVEYNSTTTQSDYGERFDAFLDFLRAEAGYRRDEWDLTPLRIAHQVLAEAGCDSAARLWTSIVRSRTSEAADRHVARLAALEKRHAMRLPTMTDHLAERFVKPFAIDRIIALVPAALREAQAGRPDTPAFRALRREVEQYLSTTTGSAADLPEWLDDFEAAVHRAREGVRAPNEERESITGRPLPRLRREQILRQIAKKRGK